MSPTPRRAGDATNRSSRSQAGEVLTERQALAALLLPSANNIAIMLARRGRRQRARVRPRMNATAPPLGMRAHALHRPERVRPRRRGRPRPTSCGWPSVAMREPDVRRDRGACRATRCRWSAPCTTPTPARARTASSASRPARTTPPAGASCSVAPGVAGDLHRRRARPARPQPDHGRVVRRSSWPTSSTRHAGGTRPDTGRPGLARVVVPRHRPGGSRSAPDWSPGAPQPVPASSRQGGSDRGPAAAVTLGSYHLAVRLLRCAALRSHLPLVDRAEPETGSSCPRRRTGGPTGVARTPNGHIGHPGPVIDCPPEVPGSLSRSPDPHRKTRSTVPFSTRQPVSHPPVLRRIVGTVVTVLATFGCFVELCAPADALTARRVGADPRHHGNRSHARRRVPRVNRRALAVAAASSVTRTCSVPPGRARSTARVSAVQLRPRRPAHPARRGRSVPRGTPDPRRHLRPGDLVFYHGHGHRGRVFHVGMSVSPGRTVAAVDPAEGVRWQRIRYSDATFGSFTHR